MDWCGRLVDGHGSLLLGAQGAAGRASLVVLLMRHGGQRGPPSRLSPADLEHPRALQSLCCLHICESKGQKVTASSGHLNPSSRVDVDSSCLSGDIRCFSRLGLLLLYVLMIYSVITALCAPSCQKRSRLTEPLLECSLVFSAELRAASVTHLKGAAAAESLCTAIF